MKITNITKEYYEVDGEKVYFLEPLEKVISIKELQKIMDTAEELFNDYKLRTLYNIRYFLELEKELTENPPRFINPQKRLF